MATVGLALTLSGAPLDIAIVLDLSGSMANTPWQQWAARFLASLNPRQDCVYLMGFSSGVGGSIWGRPDDPSLVSPIEQTTTGGGTALYDAVVAATNELALASGVELASLFNADGTPFSEAPLLGLVAIREDAAFIVEVADRDIDQDPPRRFRGRIRVLDARGREIYEESLTLENVDAPTSDPDDVDELAKHIREIFEEISDAGR